MLAPALRAALRALRRSGWRGPLLALAAAAFELSDWFVLILVAYLLQQVASFALIRHLAACRDEPPPYVDEADRDLGRVVRRAAGLGRPALRLALVNLAVSVVAALVVFAMAAGSGLSLADQVGDKADDTITLPVIVGLSIVTGLFVTFVAVAEQRIALRRDTRVGIAVLEAVAIARRHFGTVFALVLVAQAGSLAVPLVAGSAPSFLAQVAGLPVVALAQLLATAGLTHVYLSATQSTSDPWSQPSQR